LLSSHLAGEQPDGGFIDCRGSIFECKVSTKLTQVKESSQQDVLYLSRCPFLMEFLFREYLYGHKNQTVEGIFGCISDIEEVDFFH